MQKGLRRACRNPFHQQQNRKRERGITEESMTSLTLWVPMDFCELVKRNMAAALRSVRHCQQAVGQRKSVKENRPKK